MTISKGVWKMAKKQDMSLAMAASRNKLDMHQL